MSRNQLLCDAMKIPVSELIVKYMERLGIEFVFGMPGAHIQPVYDSLYHSSVKTVLAKHEQGAAFMACGCARAASAQMSRMRRPTRRLVYPAREPPRFARIGCLT